MEFSPSPNQVISINNVNYKFAPHPVVKYMSFGQEGRKSIVYQVHQIRTNTLFALKVFKKRFRGSYLSKFTSKIGQYANLPGLEVCKRTTLKMDMNQKLLAQYPDLEYATLMPWIMGDTWSDVIAKRTVLSRDQSIKIAATLAHVLSNLERRKLAHCDISSFNVIMNLASSKVSLVDVEDLYGTDLVLDENFPMGTTGYHHKSSRVNQHGQWCAEGDRFAASILLSEILCWHDAQVRKLSEDDHYYDGSELQTSTSPRYAVMRRVLKEISPELFTLFEKSWHSSVLSDCPHLFEWEQILQDMITPTPFRLMNSILDFLGINLRPATPMPVRPANSPDLSRMPIQAKTVDAPPRPILTPIVPDSTLATSSAPALVIYLIDLSKSMGQTSRGVRKIDAVTDPLNQTIMSMIRRSTKGNVVIDRYRIGIYGYHGKLIDILGGIKNISQVKALPRVPALGYGTEVANAFQDVEQILKNELPRLTNCPAPLICHLTDGIFAGADPKPVVSRIKQIAVKDGPVLVENIFISQSVIKEPINNILRWPGISEVNQIYGEKKYAQQLFEMSSVIPDSYLSIIQEFGYHLQPGARMIFPGENTAIIKLGFVMSGATPVTT